MSAPTSPPYRVRVRVPAEHVHAVRAAFGEKGQRKLLADVSARLQRLGWGEVLSVMQDPTENTLFTLIARAPTKEKARTDDPLCTFVSAERVEEPLQQIRGLRTAGILDPGLTEDEVWLVRHALLHEDNLRHVGGIASAFAPFFPIAASLLNAKATLMDSRPPALAQQLNEANRAAAEAIAGHASGLSAGIHPASVRDQLLTPTVLPSAIGGMIRSATNGRWTDLEKGWDQLLTHASPTWALRHRLRAARDAAQTLANLRARPPSLERAALEGAALAALMPAADGTSDAHASDPAFRNGTTAGQAWATGEERAPEEQRRQQHATSGAATIPSFDRGVTKGALDGLRNTGFADLYGKTRGRTFQERALDHRRAVQAAGQSASPRTVQRMLLAARMADVADWSRRNPNMPADVLRDEVRRAAWKICDEPHCLEGEPPDLLYFPVEIVTLGRCLVREAGRGVWIVSPEDMALACPPDGREGFVSPSALQLALATQKPQHARVWNESKVAEIASALAEDPSTSPNVLRARNQLERAERALERRRWIEWYRRAGDHTRLKRTQARVAGAT